MSIQQIHHIYYYHHGRCHRHPQMQGRGLGPNADCVALLRCAYAGAALPDPDNNGRVAKFHSTSASVVHTVIFFYSQLPPITLPVQIKILLG